jgi:choline dehydrogenase-like flavoprotein
VGFACLADARAGTHDTSLPRAVRTGRCSIATDTVATSLESDGRGRVIGARLRAAADRDGPGRVVLARVVVIAAGAIETARLLLSSPSTREPRGIGNDRDLVGRFLQGHVYAGAVGVFDEPVQDGLGPGPSIATTVYRHGNDGVVGGGILGDEFVPTPIETWQTLTTAGLIPMWGSAAKAGMRRLYRRTLVVVGPVHEAPVATSRVRLDPTVVDALRAPVARLEGRPHASDGKTADLLVERSLAWLRASGATAAVPVRRGLVDGPSAGTHQAGTCRMGASRSSSVTDRWGRIWGHPEVVIADASTHVTNGTVNPVLTTMANAMRVAQRLADDGR